MCGFIFSTADFHVQSANVFLQHRGPDMTNSMSSHGCHFVHNLLSMTGEFSQQPFINGNIHCVYNGEIYNAQGYPSDGHCLIDRYLEHGVNFTKHLDGEFAICLVDFDKKLCMVSSDLFRTKPIWVGQHPFAVASYKSCLEQIGCQKINMVPPNTSVLYDLNTSDIICSTILCEWNTNQFKPNTDDWCAAFENAIRKRTTNCRSGIFVGLSSGYDSGAIACACKNLGVPITTYTITGNEDGQIIKKRLRLHSGECFTPSTTEIEQEKDYLSKYMERVKFDAVDGLRGYSPNDDKSSVGLGMICQRAKASGNLIHLSGQGADEIIADYGFNGQRIYKHSQFGGKFPKQLGKIFPWRSFTGGTQQWYIAKEEHVAGSHGIESRYPFLDKDVVQEFLNLDYKIKNKHYKSVIHDYLQKNDYPVALNTKVGFNIVKNDNRKTKRIG